MVNALSDIRIFEMVPKEARSSGRALGWNNVRAVQSVPKAFVQSIMLASDVAAITVAVLIVVLTLHSSIGTALGTELMFLCTIALLILSRMFKHFSAVFAAYSAVMVLSILLSFLFPGQWGIFGLCTLCVLAFYRFPLRWSLPFTAVSILMLMETNGLSSILITHHWHNLQSLAPLVLLALSLCWVGWTRRTQYLLVAQLQEAQAQLRAEMARAEELATTRERTRIARDIHDVLAHSLSILSIQMQAARQLVSRDPERLAAKLDDMASLLRESIAESRRVVGLLRDVPPSLQDNVATSLHTLANSFNERTGIRCLFEEKGTPHELSEQQSQALQFALRESLTNAHRHGAAHTVWITLQWQEQEVVLHVWDDGQGLKTRQTSQLAGDNGIPDSGHHGLQGMRERATASGGKLEAGPRTEGGFAVTMRIPFRQLQHMYAREV